MHHIVPLGEPVPGEPPRGPRFRVLYDARRAEYVFVDTWTDTASTYYATRAEAMTAERKVQNG